MKNPYSRRHFLQAGTLSGILAPFTLGAAQASVPPTQQPLALSQSLDVYPVGDTYRVRGHIDQKEYLKSNKADEVLQFAIGMLRNGGEILLQPGTYLLHKQVNLTSHISLRGSGHTTSLVLATDHEGSAALAASNADRVTIAALSVKTPKDYANPVVGIRFDHCGDSLIQDVFCLGFTYGIQLTNQSFLCEVRGCRVADSQKSGIYLNDLSMNGRGGDFVPNLITNCMVYGGGKGIECEHALVVNIVGCQIYQTRLAGFHFHRGSNSIVISGSRTFQIRNDAVVVENSHELNISGNTFCWHEGHGIVLRNVNWGLISGNEIIDTGSYNIDDTPAADQRQSYWVKAPDDLEPYKKNGLWLSGTKGVALTGNAIFNWGSGPAMKHAILEEDTCEVNAITGNTINFCDNALTLRGKGTQETNNVVQANVPHLGGDSITKKRLHRFDVRLLERFIDAQR
jgi:Right handed beta helix region